MTDGISEAFRDSEARELIQYIGSIRVSLSLPRDVVLTLMNTSFYYQCRDDLDPIACTVRKYLEHNLRVV